MSTLILSEVFDRHPIAFVRFRGEPVVGARQLAVALGYSDSGRIADMIRSEWAADFVEGEDFHIVEGPELAVYKSAVVDTTYAGVSTDGPGTDSVLHHTRRSLMVLTESGLYLVSLRTEKALGVRLRRWLATEILPRLARGESVGGRAPDPIPVLREARRYADSMRRAGRSKAEVAKFLRTMEGRAGLVLAVAPKPPAAEGTPAPEANPGAVLDLLPVLVAELERQGFARIVRSRISPRGAEEQVAIPIGRVRAALEIQGLEPRLILAAWRDAGLLRTTDKAFTCNARINGVSVPCLMLWRAVAQ